MGTSQNWIPTKHNFPDQSANVLRIPLGDKPIFYEWGAVEVFPL